ncbi:probable ATP-dependent DNA helicase RecS [Pecten maximus]|uniref:probable ATP-dependent DNA helicase RecS n=1 Tax=Pecten maximus TaxID=6579 RepID=UPI0014591AE1|nr:probable ATP-dependent DNA helicase RecS [Pecten maximus]
MNIDELKHEFDTVKRQYSINFDAKPEQLEAAKCIMENQNVIGLLPTGYETALKPSWKDVFMSKIWKKNIIALVVDDVHCISEWAEDFRKEFRHFHELRSAIRAPVLALTATSTEAVKKDIKKYLQIEDAIVIYTSPDRPNIFLDFKKAESTELEGKLCWLLSHLREKNSAA